MDILGLSTSPSSGGAYALILTEQSGNRRLPIIIGTFEAQAIALELERIRPPRPMTHDLLRNVIAAFRAQVQAVVINDLKEGTYFAQIVFEREGERFEIDSRPSDAIAIAIRFKAPIFVMDSILDEAGIVSDEENDSEKPVAVESEEEPQKQAADTPESKIETLEKRLQTAIANEEYEKAARIRDELAKIKNN